MEAELTGPEQGSLLTKQELPPLARKRFMVQGCSMALLLIPLLWGIGFATLFLCLEQLSYFQKKIALLQF